MMYQAMTEKEHRRFRSAGCDPTCHICKKPIKVGQPYDMRKLSEGPVPKRGFEVTVEIMTCEKCEGRRLPFAEVKRAMEIIAKSPKAAQERTEDAASKFAHEEHLRDKRIYDAYKRTHPGCMVVGGVVVPGMAE